MRLKSRRGKQTMTGRIQALIPSLTRTRKGTEPSRRACQRDPSPGLLFVPCRGGSLAASQLRVKRRSADRSSVIPRRNFFFPPHLGGRKGAGGGRFESAENMATAESNQRGRARATQNADFGRPQWIPPPPPLACACIACAACLSACV